MSSDSDFDDEDDELLHALIKGDAKVSSNLVVATQLHSVSNEQTLNLAVSNSLGIHPISDIESARQRVYHAEGEIAILRAQMSRLQDQKQQEIADLIASTQSLARTNVNQVNTLRNALEKLEDEKKFLNNELKFIPQLKRRKTSQAISLIESGVDAFASTQRFENVHYQTPTTTAFSTSNIESSLLIDHIWLYCPPGCQRKSMEFLSKICLDCDITVKDLHMESRTSISQGLGIFLMKKKHLRLDELMSEACVSIMSLSMKLLENRSMLAVPFLLSLIHCAINFRPAAVNADVIKILLHQLDEFVVKKSFLLESTASEDHYADFHDLTPLELVIDRFTLVCGLDIIESLAAISTQYGEPKNMVQWRSEFTSRNFVGKILHENAERFKCTSQVNTVFNVVQILFSTLSLELFPLEAPESRIIVSLMNTLTMHIPFKAGFSFYGLNRMVGNNLELYNVEATVPLIRDQLKNYIVSNPQPIDSHDFSTGHIPTDEMKFSHQGHILALRLRVTSLFESYIIDGQSVEIFQNRETIKTLMRTIAVEQDQVFNAPRSQHVHLRIQLISSLVKLTWYIVLETNDLSTLVYPETITELFVVLLRIAFGTDSLSIDAHEMVQKARESGWKNALFNTMCEARAYELYHLDCELSPSTIANAESEFANGVEFPYETESVELARDILNVFVTHEEADTIYLNMIFQPENFDEMDLLDS